MVTAALAGTVSPAAVLVGAIRAAGGVSGSLSMPQNHAVYTGAYSVVPTVPAQTLPTRDLLMTADVEVGGIPHYEVSNPYGGSTFVIGGTNDYSE